MTTTTRINITAKDSTAAAFASASGNLTTLSSSAVRAAASIAGVTLSFAGLASSIKSSINAADETFKLSQKIGVAVEQLAGLQLAFKQSGLGAEQLQSSISKLSKNVASGNSAFAAMGIDTKDANRNLKSTRLILAEVSDKFAGYQDGIAKTTLAIQLFGRSGADVIPFLNQGSESLAQFDAMAEKLGLTLSTSTAKAAEEFNDTISLIGQSFEGLSTQVSANMLPVLNSLAEAFFNTATQGDGVKDWAHRVAIEFAGLIDLTSVFVGQFEILGTLIADQFTNIKSGNLEKMSATFASANNALVKLYSTGEKYQSQVNNRVIAESMLTNKVTGTNNNIKKLTRTHVENTAAVEKATKAKEKLTIAELEMQESTKTTISLYADVKKLTDSVATDQEKYNSALEELNRLKPYVSVETYSRALQKAQDELKGTATQTKVTTDQVDQLWTQAGRNIQSSLADSIFNFFDDGLKGMVKNVGIAVGRIASEFAALKLAQGLGIGAIFGGASGAAAASGGGSALGGAMSLGSSALSFAGGGFGSMGGIGSLLSMAPGSLGSFGLGMVSGGGSGMSAAASMGASFAGIAGPLMGAAMAGLAIDAIGNAIAGDKTIGGSFGKTMQKIPVLGSGWDVLAGLFGRGPYKYQNQSLKGTVSSSGFDGDIANVYLSKGGLFSKNKYRTEIQELSADQQGAFDSAIAQFYISASAFAENLGLSSELVDNYTREIKIKSEKGGKITEEAIAEMLDSLSNGLAENILPIVSTLKNAGEDAFATLSRLNTEFNVLVNVAGILGNSVKDSREIIQGVTFESREAFLQMAGGIESLSQQTAFFAENFLTDAEKLAPIQESLAKALDELNLSSNITKDEFKALVQSFGEVGGVSAETFTALLGIQDQFLFVANALEAASERAAAASERAAAESALEVKAKQDAIDAANAAIYAEQVRYATAESNERKRSDAGAVKREQSKMRGYLENLKDGYQAQLVQGVDKIDGALKSITESVSKLARLTGLISSAADGVKPQTLKSAQAILAAAAVRAKRGDFVDASDIEGSLSTVQSIDSNGFASSLDLARQQAIALQSMSQIAISAGVESSALSSKLPKLEQEKSDLITKMSEFIGRVDELIGDIGRAVSMGMMGNSGSLAYIRWGDDMIYHQADTSFGGNPTPADYNNFGKRTHKETAEDVLNKILAATESNASATIAMMKNIKRWDGNGMPEVRTI